MVTGQKQTPEILMTLMEAVNMSTNGLTTWEKNCDSCSSRAFVLIAIIATMAIATGRVGADELPSQAAMADAGRLSDAFRIAAEKVLPTVVSIETMSGERKTELWSIRDMSLRSQSYAQGSEAQSSRGLANRARYGTGSGVIIDRRGYIVTCQHVVDSADTILVYLSDGRRFEAVDVWSDRKSDLAVIRIEGADKLPEAALGNSDGLQVGDWVVSVGDPYGLGMSVSAGIVSATHRQSPDTLHTQVIQTDAATNPGNSGGALINLRGEVVGIAEGGYGSHAGFQGIGFAIPVNQAARIARELIDKGFIRRAYFGCHVDQISAAIANHQHLPARHGIIITDVTAASPADAAGIQVGDVLTHFAESVIVDPYHFQQMINQAEPERQYAVTVIRGGENFQVEVRLNELREDDDADRVVPVDPTDHTPRYLDNLLGMELSDLTPESARELGLSESLRGVLIEHVAVRGPAYREGVCAGMAVLKIDNHPIRTLADYRLAMENKSVDRGVLLLIGTSEGNHFVVCQQ